MKISIVLFSILITRSKNMMNLLLCLVHWNETRNYGDEVGSGRWYWEVWCAGYMVHAVSSPTRCGEHQSNVPIVFYLYIGGIAFQAEILYQVFNYNFNPLKEPDEIWVGDFNISLNLVGDLNTDEQIISSFRLEDLINIPTRGSSAKCLDQIMYRSNKFLILILAQLMLK